MVRKSALVLCFALAVAGPARAQTILSAYDWLRAADAFTSQKPNIDFTEGNALGYLQGFIQAQKEWLIVDIAYLMLEAKSNPKALFRTKHYCVPQNVSTGQIVEIAKKYMHNHPERLHEEAGYVMFSALLEVWPCEKNPT